jgi:hypothetical protein
MRGDVRIIEGKLCYAFDVSDEWLSKLNARTRFFRDEDEWKVKSIVDNVAWCYLINPLKSNNREMKRLEARFEALERYIDEEVERQERIAQDIKEWTNMPLLTKVKVWINRVCKREIFEVPFNYRFSWMKI